MCQNIQLHTNIQHSNIKKHTSSHTESLYQLPKKVETGQAAPLAIGFRYNGGQKISVCLAVKNMAESLITLMLV